MISKNWLVSSVGECCEVIRGVAFPSSAKAFKPSAGSIACLRTANVQREVEWGSLWHIPRSYVKRDEQVIQSSDILISLANSFELVGKVALVREMPYESTLGAFISAIRCNEYVLPKFVYYQLASTEKQTELRSTASTTTNISNISTSKLSVLPLSVAPVNEQARIVWKIGELLSGIDASVAALERARANLKRYRAAVLKAAVEGRLTAQWRKTHPAAEPASKLLERILAERRKKWEKAQLAKFTAAGKAQPKGWKDKYPEPAQPDVANLPELPEGWCWALIEQLCEVGTGTTPSRGNAEYWLNGTVPWIASAAVNQPYVFEAKECVTEHALSDTTLKVYPKHTLILALYGEGKTRGKISELMIPATINQALAALQTDGLSAGCRRYLKMFMLSNYENLRRNSAGGVQPNLNLGLVQQIMVPLPPLLEQSAIVDEVEAAFSSFEASERVVVTGLARTTRLRQSILKRAFEGKLVPQDPNDEPASVLLERIRAARVTSDVAPRARKLRRARS